MKKLHYNTISPLLLCVLKDLMQANVFDNFRLVGGTALSLYRGHRMSIDIDLFNDAPYNSIDFDAIDNFLQTKYAFVDSLRSDIIGMGKSYFIGKNQKDYVKLDLFYTDNFVFNAQIIDGLRLASVEEIVAMKMEVISNYGRKKDFWDIHELLDTFSLNDMLNLHQKRYPYSHNVKQIRANFLNFVNADEDFDPICLHGKYWDLIKLDLIETLKSV